MAAKAPASPDPRAEEHGKLIKERRLDLGLNRPAFVTQMQKHGQEITPDYLNKLERGTAPLSRASLEVREAIRIVLGFTAEKWHELTGLYSPASEARQTAADFTPAALGYKIPKQPLPPIPDSLIDAGIIYGDRPGMEGLKEYRWQRTMERLPHRRRPQTPEEWLALYLDLRDKLDPPEPKE